VPRELQTCRNPRADRLDAESGTDRSWSSSRTRHSSCLLRGPGLWSRVIRSVLLAWLQM
jgi:hypothetical protein